jgi:hypothetical protein
MVLSSVDFPQPFAHQHGHFLLGIAREISSTMIFSDSPQRGSPEPVPVFCVVSHVNANVIKKRNKYK